MGSRREFRAGVLFMVPALLLTALIFAYPLWKAFELSFYRYILNRPSRTSFIGIENYHQLLFEDSAFRTSVLVTVTFVVVTVLLILTLGLGIAGLLARDPVRRRSTAWADRYQVLFLLPVLMTPAVSGTIFRVFIWNEDAGLANWIIDSIFGVKLDWLVDADLALVVIVLTEVWVHLPLAVLVLYSAMRSVPINLYEAARIDGASNVRQFWHISLPYIRPQIVFVALLQTTLSFRQFEIIYLTTGGGPAGATRVLTMQIYETAMGTFNFGYANAMGVMMLLMVAAICIGIIVSQGRTTDAMGER